MKSLEASSLFSLKDKTVLLTGAGGFLGRTMTRALLQNGANVIALARSSRLETFASEWNTEFGDHRVKPYLVDMNDLDALENTLTVILEAEAPIDVLVNNAHELGEATGFNVPEGALETAPFEQWMRHLGGGLYWAALTTQKIGATMKARGGGTIINITTMYAHVAPSPQLYEGTDFINPPGYSVAKAGLVALTRYTASFWGKDGIRANSISPGPFSNTEDAGPNSVGESDPFLERLRARTCLNRIGNPDELAGALLYLASDASSFMTGQTLIVDGGWTVT